MDLKKIAALACLTFSPEEEVRLAREMEQIVAFAELLPVTGEGTYATDGVDVSALREDRVEESLPREMLLASVRAQKDGCVVVPHIGRKEGTP